MRVHIRPADPEATPPRTGEEFRRFMSHWPTGVTIVTTVDGDTPVGCTVNAMMSVSLSPPLLAVALSRRSRTLSAVRRAGAFGLSVLAADQRELCLRFSREPQDARFRDLPYWSPLHVPVLRGVVAATICSVEALVPCGDHVMVTGAPLWHQEGERESPLIFHRRGYHELAGTVDEEGPPP